MGFSDELITDDWDLIFETIRWTQAFFDLDFILSIAEQIDALFDFVLDIEMPEPIWDDLSEFFAL